ncbi:MAG: hypothetical protein ACI9IL_001159 [Rickettsiales bacterium]|jgi:hypothetical protein
MLLERDEYLSNIKLTKKQKEESNNHISPDKANGVGGGGNDSCKIRRLIL